MSSDSMPFGECPVPSSGPEEILLGHGSGGKLTARLIEKIILPASATRRSSGSTTRPSCRSAAPGWPSHRLLRGDAHLLPGG